MGSAAWLLRCCFSTMAAAEEEPAAKKVKTEEGAIASERKEEGEQREKEKKEKKEKKDKSEKKKDKSEKKEKKKDKKEKKEKKEKEKENTDNPNGVEVDGAVKEHKEKKHKKDKKDKKDKKEKKHKKDKKDKKDKKYKKHKHRHHGSGAPSGAVKKLGLKKGIVGRFGKKAIAKKAEASKAPSKVLLKTEDDYEPVNRWWEKEDGALSGKRGAKKWDTFEHHGLMFASDYESHGIPIVYNGKEIKLPVDAEEVATYWTSVKGTDY